MTEQLKNTALYNSFSHRLGSMRRTQLADDYIGETGGGGVEAYKEESFWPKDSFIVKDFKLYVANEDIPENTTFTVGTGGQTWREVSAAVGAALILQWDASTTYTAGETVIKGGLLKVANKTSTNGSDADFDDITVLRSKLTFLDKWADGIEYKKDQVVTSGKAIYRCTGLHLSSGSIDLTKFEVIGAAGKGVEPWQDIAYDKDDLVVVNYKFYIANDNIAAGAGFNVGATGATWQEVSGIPEAIAPVVFDKTNTYDEGTVVIHNLVRYTRNNKNRAANSELSAAHFDREVLFPIHKGEFKKEDLFLKGDIVTSGGSEYIANDAIPFGQDFKVGTSGASFRRITPKLFETIETETQYFAFDTFVVPEGLFIAKADFLTGVSVTITGVTELVKVETGSSGSLTMPAAGTGDAPGAGSTSTTGVTYGSIAGKGVDEAIIDLLFPVTYPTPVVPTLSVTTPTSLYEVGETPNISLDWAFGLGDSNGKDGGMRVQHPGGTDTDVTADPYILNAVALAEGSNTFTLTQPYLAGDIPNDSKGNPAPAYQLNAGEAVGTVSVTTVWPTFTLGTAVDKSTALVAATPAARRAEIEAITGAKELSTKTSYAGGIVPANKDIYLAVPGSFTKADVIYLGFPTPIAEVVDNAYVISDLSGTLTKSYTVVRLNGASLDTNYDSLTLS